MEFMFGIPSFVQFGPGVAKKAGEVAQGLGSRKVLLVYDKGVKSAGLADEVLKALQDSNLEVLEFDGVQPNPTDTLVENAAAMAREFQPDAIVALGGGSSIDCAKAINILQTNPSPINQYDGLNTVPNPTRPLIAIPTTAGTASEVTAFSIVTDTTRQKKMVIGGQFVGATIALVDPQMTLGMPSSITASTGMDALTHAIEAYVTTLLSNPITDALALQAISLIGKWLRKAVANGADMEARDAMAYAEYLAGMAFNSAGLGIVHSMAHQPGSLLGKPHGVCNAICLPVVCEFNLMANAEKYAKVAETLGEDISGLNIMEAAEKAVVAIRRLSRDVGIPSGLGEIGVTEKDIPIMAENALKDVCTLFNPRTVKVEDIVELYKKAL